MDDKADSRAERGESKDDKAVRISQTTPSDAGSDPSSVSSYADDDRPGLLARFTKGFTKQFDKVQTTTSRMSVVAREAKDARSNHLNARKELMAQMQNGRTALTDEDYNDEHPHAAGGFAYAANKEAHMISNTSSMKGVGIGTGHVSPISSMSKDRIKKLNEERLRKIEEEEAMACAEPASNLGVWYDAGFWRDRHGNLEAKKPLPPEYDYCPWATKAVPQMRQVETGIVIWPVRFDLVPFYQHFEESDHSNVRGADGHGPSMNMQHATTVYHYTSKVAYTNIISPPEESDASEVQEPHAFAREIWERIADDLHRRRVDKILGASDFSLPLVSLEPAKFQNREAVACAVYRAVSAKHQHLGVAYCISVLVPTDKCLAVDEEHAGDTVLVLAPGEDADDDGIDQYDASGKKKEGSKLVKWSMKADLFAQKKEVIRSTAENVHSMSLLEGLIDREKEKEVEAAEKEAGNRSEALKEAALHISKATNQDEEEDRLEDQLQQLELDRELVVRKIKHAFRAKEKCEEGKEVRFLETDDYRIRKLNGQIEKIEIKIDSVKGELRQLRADLEISIPGGEGGKEDAGDSRKMRRRRKKKEEKTLLSGEVMDEVGRVEDEYNKLAGNVFREVFGGHGQGVEDLLEAKGDPNLMDLASGWFPLHMAASTGDTEIVQLLCKAAAVPTCRSRDHGLVPMHIAVRKSTAKMLECLLVVGARAVREKANDGTSPLLMCLTSSPHGVRNKMVSMFMEAHADANAERKDGWTPLAWAVDHEMKAVCKMLVLHGGKVLNDMPDSHPKVTIWQAAAKHKDLQDIIKEKLNSRDLQALERKFPGTIKRSAAGGRTQGHNDDD